MADKPTFVYAALYDTVDDANFDYEAVFDLHAAGVIGTFDAAVIENDGEKVHVHKAEKPTQHGAWAGIGVGALVGVLFPPSILVGAVAGGAAGGLIGHFRKGMPRGELKDLGQTLGAGQAAIIVIGESKIQEQLEKDLTRANKVLEDQVDVDADELKKELDEAAKQGGAS